MEQLKNANESDKKKRMERQEKVTGKATRKREWSDVKSLVGNHRRNRDGKSSLKSWHGKLSPIVTKMVVENYHGKSWRKIITENYGRKIVYF